LRWECSDRGLVAFLPANEQSYIVVEDTAPPAAVHEKLAI